MDCAADVLQLDQVVTDTLNAGIVPDAIQL